MDAEYFGLMVLRGIGQAGLPVTGVKRLMKDNSLFNVETADQSQFLVKIVKYEPEPDLFSLGKNRSEKNDNNKDLCADIFKRPNLQAIGYFIKEEGNLNDIHCTSFATRDSGAEEALKEKLTELLDEKTAEEIYYAVLNYSIIKEEIQFSLGMKAGARLILLLTDSSEYDF